MDRHEQAIQRAIFAHFTARGARDCYAFHCPNGGARSKVEAAILKGLGVRAGVPDIIAIRDGRAYALELKAPGAETDRGPARCTQCTCGSRGDGGGRGRARRSVGAT
jgi:hypothetical protein